jgi:hypothetical protein
VIIISKAILSAETAQHIQELASGLEPAPLRDLALELATQPDLRVSVITYQDGTAELEVLDEGAPRHDEDTIDCGRFTRPGLASQARTLGLAGEAWLHDAVNLIRATMRDASGP